MGGSITEQMVYEAIKRIEDALNAAFSSLSGVPTRPVE
jgi:hypothetical protein